MQRPPRAVADVALDALLAEVTRYYDGQDVVPADAALHAIGFRVGAALAERAAASRPRPADTLDAVKVVCKDVWPAAHGKPVDGLRTNHRGTYVLRDAAFRRLAAVAGEAAAAPAAAAATSSSLLRLHAGAVAGALAALGVDAAVAADGGAAPPAADFTVVVRRGLAGEGAG